MGTNNSFQNVSFDLDRLGQTGTFESINYERDTDSDSSSQEGAVTLLKYIDHGIVLVWMEPGAVELRRWK